MARKVFCPVCSGDHFRRVVVTLPKGSVRDTDFVYCCRCLLMLYRAPSVEAENRPRKLHEGDLLPLVGVAAINEGLRRLPDANFTEQPTLSVPVLVDYHGHVSIEYEWATGQADGRTWRFWLAKSAKKVV